MDTYEAIMTRRSVPKAAEAVPPVAHVKRLLDAAVTAPNHHLTEPWRFVVLSADALKELGEVFAKHAERTGGNAQLAPDLPLRAPIVVVVVERPPIADPHVPEMEDHLTEWRGFDDSELAAAAAEEG